MRITFLLPFIFLTGGIKAPLEYANHLCELGHQVIVIYPRRSPYLRWDPKMQGAVKRITTIWRREMRYWVWRLLGQPELRWMKLMVPLIRVPALSANHIPSSDVVVAVDWTTARWLGDCDPSKGRQFYLIQHYETWSGPSDRVDATWQLPMGKIVVSSWLKDLAEKKFGQEVLGPLIPGVDSRCFYNDHKIYHIPRRVGMLYHDLAWKGVADGLRAFRIARQKHPDIQLVMYGAERPETDLPDYVEFHFKLLGARLRKVYCSCDIWLCPSWMEGAGMPSMEAMACKCALVTTDVGAVRDYAVPEETALISPPRDPEALARNLIRLLDDEEELQRISLAGYKNIREFTWERSTRQLERYLRGER